ncbi:MAG: NAD(P)/FAD-dependent oxidoreductase, partial [Peptostreptococcaceae bacterium]
MNTNGNLQKIKNGKKTYAITPHIPGGFITPDNLIKIGEVAKKYNGV